MAMAAFCDAQLHQTRKCVQLEHASGALTYILIIIQANKNTELHLMQSKPTKQLAQALYVSRMALMHNTMG